MARPGRLRKYNPVADDIYYSIRRFDNTKVQKLVLNTSIELPDGYSRTPLIQATLHKNIEILNWLIEKGANVNHQDRNGYCALHFAAQERFADVALILLKNGAITELRDIYGNTPLWTSAFNAKGDYSVFRLLLEYGANLDNMNNSGRTIREMTRKMFPQNDLENIMRSLERQ